MELDLANIMEWSAMSLERTLGHHKALQRRWYIIVVTMIMGQPASFLIFFRFAK